MIPIEGATVVFERLIRAALDRYPKWYVNAARVAKIVISNSPDVKANIAQMEHGSRILYVWPGIGDLLQKALGHELAHGCDDNFGSPHYFSSTPEWIRIHREQAYFDIDKYRDEPLEYLADMCTKLFLLGPQKLSITNPNEVTFISTWMFPTLMKEFSK